MGPNLMLTQYNTILFFSQLFDSNKMALFFLKVLKFCMAYVIIHLSYDGLKIDLLWYNNCIIVSLPCSISFTKCVNYVS